MTSTERNIGNPSDAYRKDRITSLGTGMFQGMANDENYSIGYLRDTLIPILLLLLRCIFAKYFKIF